MLINKEAEVCHLLNEFVENRVKELWDNMDSNWLLYDQETIRIPKCDIGANKIYYVETSIKDVLFSADVIYYIPKCTKQQSVKRLIVLIDEECKKIEKKYTEYITIVEKNKETLEILNEIYKQ